MSMYRSSLSLRRKPAVPADTSLSRSGAGASRRAETPTPKPRAGASSRAITPSRGLGSGAAPVPSKQFQLGSGMSAPPKRDLSKYHNGDPFANKSRPAAGGASAYRTTSTAASSASRSGVGSSLNKRVSAPGPGEEHKPILVLDMDETLIHTLFSPTGCRHTVLHRPGLYEFLDAMVVLYRLVVFTAGLKEYADLVLDAIDPEGKYFSGRFYRDSCRVTDGIYCKDLRGITGDELSRCLIIDNIPENYMLQPENGIPITDYIGDERDTALLDLIPMLKAFPSSGADIRVYLKKNLKTVPKALQAGYYFP